MKKRRFNSFDVLFLFGAIICMFGIVYLVALWRSDLPLWMKFFLTMSSGR